MFSKFSDKKKSNKFSTLSGVFVPSVLAIVGAVMYLILPKVLGGVGIWQMLLIILLAHMVSIATAFSISAIATNIQVKGGGMYYLISRSLGSAFGGGLGIQLYLAQTVAIGFYCIAFARGFNSILSVFGFTFDETALALIAGLIFGIIAFRGAQFVIRLQYIILATIVLSIISIFLGPTQFSDITALGTQLSFWVAFALFFPAVTGIDAGVAMSGDLKNPRRSIVRGSFCAIAITLVIYMALAIKLSFSASAQELFTDPLIIQKMAFIPAFVIAGIILATSSSALSYLMAAPRTLRALSLDNIFPSKLLARTIGKSNEPRIALILTLLIVFTVISSGDLEFVSLIVTIFFLNVYGWINGTAFLEKISQNPSYRPSFNAPAWVSFIGMFLCYAVMYLFNPLVMVISIAFQLSVFYILYKTKASIKLESVWDGVLFQLLRAVINKIEKTEESKKNWRPTVVAFCANDVNRNILFSLLDWIGANKGIMKFYYFLPGAVEKSISKREKIEDEMKQYIKDNEFDLYPRVIETNEISQSVESTLQSETIGNLPLNTALIDFDTRFKIDALSTLTARLKKNVIILKNNTGFSDFKYVDVWWEEPKNGNLMILIAYLISHSKTWMEHNATIRLFNIVKSQQEYDVNRVKIAKLLDNSRIDNISFQIIIEKKKPVPQVIRENSHYADLVLLGFPHLKSKGISKDAAKQIENYTQGLTTSLIVLANDEIDFTIN